MTRSARRPLVRLLTVLLALGVLAGCASVPDASPVQVLRKITEGDGAALPPGPGVDTDPLQLVRGFVNASASADNRHAAARLFLTPKAQGWDDGASLTVLDDQVEVTYSQSPAATDQAVVRLRGTQLGRLNSDGSFVQDEAAVDMDIQLSRVAGQWRISGPPPGALVRFADFHANYKAVKVYYIDAARHRPVSDRRYLAASPAQSLPSRVMDLVLGGPSATLATAAASAVPASARLRSNVAPGPDGVVTVDLTELGELGDGQRRQIAEQVVFSLAEVDVTKVRLLGDGAPLLPGHPDLTKALLVDLTGDADVRPDVPGVVVLGGRVHTLVSGQLGGPVAGPSGGGGYDLSAATMSRDGQRLAAVNRLDGRQLLVGAAGGRLAPTGVQGASMTRPTWSPAGDEVWTVCNQTTVSRAVLDQSGHATVAPVDASELTALGPVQDLRLSRDGARIAAVVGGQLVTGAVSRSASGAVAVRNVRVLRPRELTDLVSVDWRADDELAVAGRRAEMAVALVSVDGLDFHPLPSNNLTPPLSSIATAPGRPLLVTDQNGLWTFGSDEVGSWLQLAGGGSSVAGYPG